MYKDIFWGFITEDCEKKKKDFTTYVAEI